MAQSDVDSFLGGREGVSAQFPKVGHSYEGIILSFEMEQQRDYDDSNVLLWWDKEETQPKMHLVISLQTNARGKFTKAGVPMDVPGDDGKRNLFVKGALKTALTRSLRDAGVKTLEEGARLKVTYVGDGNQDNPKYNAPKQYKCEYTPAAKANAEDFLQDDAAPTDDPFA